jgi:hypothetical protein
LGHQDSALILASSGIVGVSASIGGSISASVSIIRTAVTGITVVGSAIVGVVLRSDHSRQGAVITQFPFY